MAVHSLKVLESGLGLASGFKSRLGLGLRCEGSGSVHQQILFKVHFLINIKQYVNNIRLTVDQSPS